MKTIVITGASSGLGEELARRFAAEGHQVCALARRADRLKSLEDEYPDHIHAFPVDISSQEAVADCFKTIGEQFAAVDVLINNAGYVGGGVVGKDDWSESANVIDINLKGTMFCCYGVIPLMKKKQSGRIINISSIASLPGGALPMFQSDDGTVQTGAYGISKAGMNAIGEVLGHSLQQSNITLSTIIPGAIDTPLWYNEKGECRYPIQGAQLMKASEVADMICFVASQHNHICYKSITMFPTCEWK